MKASTAATAVACLTSLGWIVGCSAVAGYCAAAAECDDLEAFLFDPVGESNDSDAVCVADNEGALRALRANEEDGCFEEAAATEKYFACVADAFARDEGDACDGFLFDDDRNPCFAELDDILDLRDDNGDDCSAGEE
jgi:hypothetical protein